MMDWPNMAGGLSNGSKPDYSLQKGKVQKRFAVLAIRADFAYHRVNNLRGINAG